VRASRATTGRVGRNVEVDDDKFGFVAAMRLNPQEARVLLRVALLKPRSMADLQRIFDEYLSGSSAPTKGRRE
jgi:L-asparaginase